MLRTLQIVDKHAQKQPLDAQILQPANGAMNELGDTLVPFNLIDQVAGTYNSSPRCDPPMLKAGIDAFGSAGVCDK